MPEMSIQQANFYERMREKKQEEEDKQKSEARFAQTLNATVKAYADTLPEGEGNQLKAQNAKWGHEERQGYLNSLSLAQAYAKQQDAKLRTKQAEDTMEFYRNLPRQVGSRLTESALQRGLAGWRETLGEWSQPNATTPTPTDVRQLTSRYPGAGLDPVISRTVMGGMEEASAPGKWNLNPDDVRDFGNGIIGLSQSPNSRAFFQTSDRTAEMAKARTAGEDPKQRSYQNELTSALDDEAKAWQALRAERSGSTRWDSLNQVYNAAKQRRAVAERRLTPTAAAAPAGGASVPASQPAPAAVAVPPEHAAYLKAHPEKRTSFEQKYGVAAAAAILD